MTTEREEWSSRYNNDSNDEGYNRERRPYQTNSRQNNYGRQENRNSYSHGGGGNNRSGGNYDRQNTGGYNRQGGSYDRQNGGYDRQGGGYNRQSGGYERQSGSYNRQSGDYGRPRQNYNHSQGGYNDYERSSYNQRPQRQYDNASSEIDGSGIKKRRPRVGESFSNQRPTNPYGAQQERGERAGGYNNNRQQQRPQLNRNQGRPGGRPNPNMKYSVQKQLKYREENFDPNEPLRLNKYLANAGVCSRREADEFIQAGLVKVNGILVTELGTKVKRADEVMFHDQPIKLEHKVYVLLNKPKNCVTTADDPQERLTVMDLVKNACQERIFPVGRLDRNTTGVLLLTNDGDLASKLTHPKFLKKKIYHVWLDKPVSMEDMQKLVDGIELEDGEIHADAISYVMETEKDQVGIEIHSGRNRIVRRMFETLGYHVNKLDRVYFAGLTKKNLKRGQWRYLNEKEVSMLRMGAFE
ncbi:rRNA pseudouridine synthase [Bacteroidales bacterium OttesenSCG-928-M11]|nr:rRNA pseudouridine synthase [Bacteroidales bacterium OttesenSCG-928-M11]